jgi:hypothetical protein
MGWASIVGQENSQALQYCPGDRDGRATGQVAVWRAGWLDRCLHLSPVTGFPDQNHRATVAFLQFCRRHGIVLNRPAASPIPRASMDSDQRSLRAVQQALSLGVILWKKGEDGLLSLSIEWRAGLGVGFSQKRYQRHIPPDLMPACGPG